MFREWKIERRMTIIQRYRRHAQSIAIPCYLVGLLLVMACVFAHAQFQQLVLASFAAILIIALFIAITRFACPRCGKPMGLISKTSASRRTIGKPVVCRHCGVDVEQPC
jgi:predicted RNA-binding Zn-ribbon protein involved in translation (DUF1610 family)